jgi:hypothetical protein
MSHINQIRSSEHKFAGADTILIQILIFAAQEIRSAEPTNLRKRGWIGFKRMVEEVHDELRQAD